MKYFLWYLVLPFLCLFYNYLYIESLNICVSGSSMTGEGRDKALLISRCLQSAEGLHLVDIAVRKYLTDWVRETAMAGLRKKISLLQSQKQPPIIRSVQSSVESRDAEEVDNIGTPVKTTGNSYVFRMIRWVCCLPGSSDDDAPTTDRSVLLEDNDFRTFLESSRLNLQLAALLVDQGMFIRYHHNSSSMTGQYTSTEKIYKQLLSLHLQRLGENHPSRYHLISLILYVNTFLSVSASWATLRYVLHVVVIYIHNIKPFSYCTSPRAACRRQRCCIGR